MVRFMFTTEEMRLKSQAQAASIDYTSSSPMVLLANSNTSARRYNVATDKQMMAFIQSQQALLDKYGHDNMGLNAFGGNMSSGNLASSTPVALHNVPAISYVSYNSPSGFHMPQPVQLVTYQSAKPPSTLAQFYFHPV
ncbi:hypothetical protein Tco_1315545 [Tanacetum coccineum]